VRIQRGEAAVGTGQVGGDDVGVQLWVAGARESVPVRGGDEPLAGDALGAGMPAAGEARLALQVRHGRGDSALMRKGQLGRHLTARDRVPDRHALRRREGQIDCRDLRGTGHPSQL
jgi:hypothetical protein